MTRNMQPVAEKEMTVRFPNANGPLRKSGQDPPEEADSEDGVPCFTVVFLTVNFVVTADIEKDYLFFRNEEGERNSVTVRQTDGVATVKPAAQRVERQVRLEGICLQVG